MNNLITENPTTSEASEPDARMLTGLVRWADMMGVDPDNVLAISSSILGGLAGPMASLDFPWGTVEVPKLDLIVPESHGVLPQALAFLLSGPRAINQQILESMAGIHPAELRHVLHGSFAGDPSKADPASYVESSNIRNLRYRLGFEDEDERPRSSEMDLAPDLRQRRIESLTRPSILLESPGLAELPKLLAGCHLSSALGVRLNLESNGSPKRKQELARLMALLHGTEMMVPASRFPAGIEHSRPCGLHAIFAADARVLRSGFTELSRLMEHSLLICNTPVRCIVDPTANHFFHFYSKVAGRIAVQRRNGMPLIATFRGNESAFRFQKENLEYLSGCDAAGPGIGACTRGLPSSLAWTFLMLRDHMHGIRPPSDDEIVTAVFAAARKLLARHGRRWVDLSEAARREQLLHRVRAIVRKIGEKRTVTFTELVHSFDNQRTSLYRPLVEVLIEAEVLEKRQGKLALGPRRFEEVSEDLFLVSTDGESNE
jgi:hypothetical protein